MEIIAAVGVILLLIFLAVKSIVQPTGNFKNIKVGEIVGLLKENREIVFLDVRTSKETAISKIKNATEINVLSPKFSKEVEQLDRSKNYLVYCRSGRRSAKACSIMSKKGFSKLYNLEGGYTSWQKDNSNN